jgi:putative ABC transport system substrate-binding protein
MKRRDFIAGLGGAAAWPLAARAQQPGRLPTIGYLGNSTRAVHGQWITVWLARLRELGWIDGRNLAIEYRFAEARTERFAEIAAEFVRLDVDVIFTANVPPAFAAKQATAIIPIVFTAVADPVGNGIVASLARPGGNATGIAGDATDAAAKRVMIGKRIELLREVVPGLRRLTIMGNSENAGAVQGMGIAQEAADTLGIEAAAFPIRRAEDISAAFEAFKSRADGLYVYADALTSLHQTRINTLALVSRLPTVWHNRPGVEAGGLISYGANLLELYRRAADYVDKILRGAKPADLPVEQPTKFELVINLTTAKALGLQVPYKLLALADEVIE